MATKVKQLREVEPTISIRTIAKRLNLSRGTVERMLKGYVPGVKKQEYDDLNQQKREEQVFLQESLPRPLNPNSESSSRNEVEFKRCKGCGGMVQVGVDCLKCKVALVLAPSFDCYLNELLTPVLNSYPVSGIFFPGKKS